MTHDPFPGVLSRLAAGERLTREEMRAAMDRIMSGEVGPARIGAFLMGLRVRGETSEEIAGAAESMRAHARPFPHAGAPLMDTCGTGGDGGGTFNISTACAFVVAGAGVPVAKHGNRSVSSRCGSADVLEALGARIDLEPEATARCLEATGVGFLFAPHYHGATRHAAGPRRELAMRTLFNLLGPLSNPARLTHQLMGVYAPELTETAARVLGLLGIEGALVVHGHGGLDELALDGPSRVSAWRDGTVSTSTVIPEEVGVTPAPAEALAGGDAPVNAGLIRDVLCNRPGPRTEVVALNAGAALLAAGRAGDLREGVEEARRTLASGAAKDVLDRFLAFTRSREDGRG